MPIPDAISEADDARNETIRRRALDNRSGLPYSSY